MVPVEGVLAVLPFALLFLLCPLMMLFMHRGHGDHGDHAGHGGGREELPRLGASGRPAAAPTEEQISRPTHH